MTSSTGSRIPQGVVEGGSDGRWGRIPALTDAGLIHGFSCRDLPSPAATLAARLGLGELPRRSLRQRHTARVHLADARRAGEEIPWGDALVARGPDIVLTISTADCLPVLLLDPAGSAFGAVHAGWRGTLAGVLDAALRRMVEELGAAPAAMRAGIGPGIRACCFEVGPEVVESFTARYAQASEWFVPGPRGRTHLDLVAANRHQLIRAGVPEGRIADAGWCTRCRADLFHSYRREGAGAGRIVTLAAAGSPSGTPLSPGGHPD